MKNPSYAGWLNLLVEKWKFLSATIASLLMDLIFLVAWSLALLGFDKVIDYFDPTGSHLLISIGKVVFDFSTLIAVFAFIVSDLIKVVARLRAEHRKEPPEAGDNRRLDE